MINNKLTIIMYHYVRDLKSSSYSRIKGLDVSRFKSQLDYIQGNYTCVGFDEIRCYCQDGVPLPHNACWLTFDDGYSDHYHTVFPELLSRNIRAAFFPAVITVEEQALLGVNKIQFVLASVENTQILVSDLKEMIAQINTGQNEIKTFGEYWLEYAQPSRYDDAQTMFVKRILQYALPEKFREPIVDRLFHRYVSADSAGFAQSLYMSKTQLRELVEAGMCVGGHGHSHVWLNKLDTQQKTTEIDETIRFLHSLGACNGDDWVMCYPYGGYDQETIDLLRTRNCLLGLTTRPDVAILEKDCLLELPRFDTNDFPS